MTEEKTLNIEGSLGFGDTPVEKPRRPKKIVSDTDKKPEVKEPEVKEPEVQEPEVKKPEVKKPKVKKPDPVVKPWEPLVRPMRKKNEAVGPGRSEMRRTRR